MCMPMGGGGSAPARPAAVVPAPDAFTTQLNSQLKAKPGAVAKEGAPAAITRDNPLLARSQRAKLDTKNLSDAQVGLQIQ